MAHVERRCGCGSRSSRGCRCKRDQVRYRARYIDPTGRERSKTFDRVVDADRFVATVETDKLRGTYVDPSAGRVTFRAYAERWRKAQRHRPGTEALYERVLRLHAYPVLGDRGLASVRHSDAQAFITGLSRALAPNTARQVHAIVRTIFRAAVHDAVLPASPIRQDQARPGPPGPGRPADHRGVERDPRRGTGAAACASRHRGRHGHAVGGTARPHRRRRRLPAP